MENKVKVIEIKSIDWLKFLPMKYGEITKKDGFTTNKNYIGHTANGVPVYINEKNELGVKEIMENKEYKEIPVGKYQAKVEQVIRKNADGKETISLELIIDGFADKQYVVYCVNGYSEIQMKIAKEQIDKICSDFGIAVIDELAGKDIMLTAKKNSKGYTNLYVAPKRAFFDWENYAGFKYTDTIKFDCSVKKFYKSKLGNKYIFYVVASVDNANVEEFVVYDFDRQFQQENFNKVLKCLHLSLDDCDKDLIDKQCKLVVKRAVGDTRVFINKKLGFDFKKK